MKHLLFANKALSLLAIAFFFGAFLAMSTGYAEFAMAAGLIAVALCFVPKGLNTVGQVNDIVIADIITEYGNYYRKGSQSLKDIFKKLFQPSVTEAFFTPRLTTSTRLELGTATITRVLQAYQSAFTPIGDTTFKPSIINLDHMKIDAKILPHDLMESWLGYLAENGLKPADCPIVKYWLEELVIPQYQEDLELNEIFAGKKGTVVANTPAPAGQSMNGIKEKLKEAGVVTVTMGAIPTGADKDFVDYVEDWFSQLPQLVRKDCKRIGMKPDLELRFIRGMREKYNMQYAQQKDLTKLADFDATVVGLPSHGNHDVIWTTPEINKIIANKNPQNQSLFDIQPFNREVKALTDFHKGLGWWYNQLVYKTDISLT